MRARKLIAAAATAAALAGGVALSAPANATSYYDTDGTYGGGYMGDYDGSAYANMFSVVGVSYSASDAENFGQTMCQAMRMGHSESEIAASAAQFTSRLTTRGTSYTARNITSARATTEERPDEEARWTSTTWWRLPTSPSS